LKLRDVLEKKEGIILDIEGTIISRIEGGHVYKDAKEFIINSEGRPIVLLTNLARRSSKYVSSVLRRSGLDFSSNEIINPTIATVGRILDQEFEKPVRIFLISEGGHYEDLVGYDWIELVREDPVDAILLGASRDITYQQLNFAFRAILKGAMLIVLGGELWAEGSQFGDSGPFLMEGAFARALEEAAGIKARYIGKPNKEIFEEALSKLNLPREKVLLVGDSIESDIVGAYRVGIDAILIDRTRKKEKYLIEHINADKEACLSSVYITDSLSLDSEIKKII